MLQTVGGPGKVGGAIGDVDAAKNGRLGHGSADAQIDAARQLGVGVLKIELGRGEDVNIQPHVAGRRVGIRRHVGRWTGGKAGEVHIRADDEARDLHTAAKQHVVLRALQVQGGVGGGADAAVANPDIFAGSRKVSV